MLICPMQLRAMWISEFYFFKLDIFRLNLKYSPRATLNGEEKKTEWR